MSDETSLLEEFAGMESFSLLIEEHGIEGTAKILSEAYSGLAALLDTLSPANRSLLLERLRNAASEECMGLLTEIFNKAAGKQGDGDGGANDGWGANDKAPDTAFVSRQDIERILRRNAALQMAAEEGRNNIAQAVRTLASSRVCDVHGCADAASVFDNKCDKVYCASCDWAKQTQIHEPSFSRFTTLTLGGVPVARLLTPNESVVHSSTGALATRGIVSLPLPEFIKLRMRCPQCTDHGEDSRWVADDWDDGDTKVIWTHTVAGSYYCVRARRIRCAESGCSHVTDAPPHRCTSSNYVNLSSHARVSTDLLSTLTRIDEALKYGFPVTAVVSLINSSGAPSVPVKPLRDIIYAWRIVYAQNAAAPTTSGVICMNCPVGPSRRSVEATDDAAVSISSDDLNSGEKLSGSEVASSIAAFSDVMENRPRVLSGDGDMKVFCRTGRGLGDGVYDELLIPLSKVTLLTSAWDFAMESDKGENNHTSCADEVSGGEATFKAPKTKGGKSPNAISGMYIVACTDHNTTYKASALLRGELYLYPLLALLLLARTGKDDLVLLCDLACLFIRSVSRLSKQNENFAYPIVELLFPGEFKSVTISVELGDNNAQHVNVTFTQTDGTVVSAQRLHVALDNLHALAHNCVDQYGPDNYRFGMLQPSIERLNAQFGPRMKSLTNSATSTHQSMTVANLHLLNADGVKVAVSGALRRLLTAFDRAAKADSAVKDEIDLLRGGGVGGGVIPTADQLEAISQAHRTRRPPLTVPLVASLSLKSLTHQNDVVGRLRAYLMPLSKTATRQNQLKKVEKEFLRPLLDSVRPIPKGWPKPKEYTIAEAERLLRAWTKLLSENVRKAHPLVKGLRESSEISFDRLANDLYLLFLKYHRLSIMLKKQSSPHLHTKRNGVKKVISDLLKQIAIAASTSKSRVTRNWRVPSADEFVKSESCIDNFPKNFSLNGVVVANSQFSHLAQLRQRYLRRNEDVVNIREEIYGVPATLSYVASRLEADALIAAGFLFSPPSNGQVILDALRRSAVFADTTVGGEQPLAVKSDSLLHSPNHLTPMATAGLQFIMTRNLAASSQVRLLHSQALNLAGMVKRLPVVVVPARDARQIIASRFEAQFLDGKISWEKYASLITGSVNASGAGGAGDGVAQGVAQTGDDNDGTLNDDDSVADSDDESEDKNQLDGMGDDEEEIDVDEIDEETVIDDCDSASELGELVDDDVELDLGLSEEEEEVEEKEEEEDGEEEEEEEEEEN